VIGLSVIVGTQGRPTLERTLDSIRPQLTDADELVVVHSHEVAYDPRGGRGGTEKMEGIRRATRSHLVFMDDDDVYVPGALDLMRDAACERPVIFRMDGSTLGLGVLWREPVLRYTNVSTQMFVVPNQPDKLGVWTPYQTGNGTDFSFLLGCVAKMGAPVWRDEIVAVLRPNGAA